MKNFLEEFKAFAMRGSVLDLAVGVIIGAAFGKIVTSLVNDIVMPLVGLIAGKVNFSELFIDLSGAGHTTMAAAKAAGAATLNYGAFLQNVFDFAIVALAIFVSIKCLNKIARTKVADLPGAVKP